MCSVLWMALDYFLLMKNVKGRNEKFELCRIDLSVTEDIELWGVTSGIDLRYKVC